MQNSYEHFLKLAKNDCSRRSEAIDYLIKNQAKILRDAALYKPPKEYKYLITFTVDPKLHEQSMNTLEWQRETEAYIVKMLSPLCFGLMIAKEHPHSNVHWHTIVRTTKPIESYHLTYYRKKYGLVDVNRSKVMEHDEYSKKYIGKEDSIRVIKSIPEK